MNTAEAKLKIKGAKDLNWFNTKKITINFTHQKHKPEITSVVSIFQFIENQVKGWDKLEDEFISQLSNSRDVFRQLKIQIEDFVNKSLDFSDDQLSYQWNNYVLPYLNQLSNCFEFDSPEIEFLLKVHKTNPTSFLGALNYIQGGTGSITNKDYFNGAILAYEFSLNGKSEISNRSQKEQKSLEDLKNIFQTSIDTSNTQLVEYLRLIDEKYKEYTNELTQYKTNKQAEVNEWFKETVNDFHAFDSSSKNRIEELEKTYQEKLRLSKPADYWKQRATTLKSEGWKALRWLVAVIIFACITLYLLLWFTPKEMLNNIFDGNSSAIRWSIVYITFISFLAIGIRAISKVMFSSFHLSRDSEEREQLTYFYLALINNKAVDEKDKHLIMQSLFSRADTGLLKEDSSPTMPSGIDKFVGK